MSERVEIASALPPGALAALLCVGWAALCVIQGTARWEHAVFATAAPALAYGTPAMRRLWRGLVPLVLIALLYDAMRYVEYLGIRPERVHVCDLRALDMRLASVFSGGAAVSVTDWLQQHPSRALDLLSAVPYGTFIFVMIAFACYLYAVDDAALRRFGWVLLALHIAAFVTYHVYPAAPPWYYHAHGCRVSLDTRASAGPNLARVDDWLGVRYFTGFYARSNDVFGAVPSLHVAYPLLIAIYAWPRRRVWLRVLTLSYFALMCFAALYLDHHWLVDVLVGIVYALVVELAQRALTRVRAARAS